MAGWRVLWPCAGKNQDQHELVYFFKMTGEVA